MREGCVGLCGVVWGEKSIGPRPLVILTKYSPV